MEDLPATPFTPEQLLPLLRQAVGDQAEWVRGRVANRQRDYWVLLVELRRPALKVVVKLAGPRAEMASQFDRTAWLNRLVATRTDIPMPEILAVDASGWNLPWRYLIQTYLPGRVWMTAREQMSAQERAGAYRQIGAAVAQLHTLQFPAFGELEAGGEGAAPAAAFLPAFRQRARASIRSERLQALFFAALEPRGDVFTSVRQACLCHEDLHGYNLIFGRRRGAVRLAGILDFDKAWAGHAEIDLARLEFWRGMTSPEFWQAYQAICPVDPLYAQRRPLYQLLWCLEYARSTPEHLADTRRLCVEQGFPSPDGFD